MDDTLCVGAGAWRDGLIGFAAWMNDETTPELDGFQNVQNLTFRFWDASENEEFGQIGVRTASTEDNINKSILVTDLEFATPIRKPETPTDFSLGPIYPNPFNSQTIVHYSLTNEGPYNIKLYDSAGRIVTTLVSGNGHAGSFYLSLNGANLSSGIYLIRLKTRELTISRKIQLVK